MADVLREPSIQFDYVAVKTPHWHDASHDKPKVAKERDEVMEELLLPIDWVKMRFDFNAETLFEEPAKPKKNLILETLNVDFYAVWLRNLTGCEQRVVSSARDSFLLQDRESMADPISGKETLVWRSQR